VWRPAGERHDNGGFDERGFDGISPSPGTAPRSRRQRDDFSALFLTSLVILRVAVPADPTDPGAWLANPASRDWVGLALNLFPFTGIAFLWFMGVLRNRISGLEDQFFATVFLGSGFLFVAMLFICGAVSQGMLGVFGAGEQLPDVNETYAVGRRTAYRSWPPAA
jgi:hypothetical protein